MTIPKRLATTVALTAILSAVVSGQRVSRARVSPLPPSEWTDAHREALGTLGRGDQTVDVFKTCLRNLALCRAWMPFTRYILSAENGIAAREKEMLILRTSFLCNADYDWAHHVPGAKRAGLTDEDIIRISKGPDAAGWNAADRALLRAADELHRDQHITDATWTLLKQRYSDNQLMDLVLTVGQYTLVSMFLNSAGVQLEPGFSGLPR
jgi:4-carboxymuconolactone decarboxylase